MGMLDFLTEGAPIPAGTVPTSKTRTSATPDWYTNYAKDLLAGQRDLSLETYAKPPMPRVAGFTPTETKGMEATVDAAGTAAAPIKAGLDVATGLVGKSGLTTAQPYLDAAGKPVYEGISNYMNPYNDAVTNRIAELGARNLREQILPGINDQFIAGGSAGGSRNAEMFNRAARDTSENILAQQNAALQAGYTGALTSSAADLQRQANLAGTAGDLGTAAVRSGLDVAKGITDIGVTGQESGLAGAAAITGVGAAERGMDQRNIDVAVADWGKEQGWPQAKIDEALKTMKGVADTGAVPKAETETAIEATGKAQQYEPSPISEVGGVVTGGAAIFKALKDAGLI